MQELALFSKCGDFLRSCQHITVCFRFLQLQIRFRKIQCEAVNIYKIVVPFSRIL